MSSLRILPPHWLLLILICCVLASSNKEAYGQHGNVWAFGDSAGIDFNTNPPSSFKSSITTNEGVASICNDGGKLLFYTDGNTIWDRYHQAMPHGRDLPGVGRNVTSSTSQGALIIPIPGRATAYYVFSLASYESQLLGRLYYCIVDMARNNGRGDVVPETKSQLLAADLTEHMTAVVGNSCNIWLVVASRIKEQIRSFDITRNGLDTIPVNSAKIPGRGAHAGIIGTVAVSPDRRKIAFAHGNVVLYDFNASTGAVSNPVTLEQYGSPEFYGVAFSPDNTKLYISSGPSGLRQFDLSLADTQLIIASKKKITTDIAWHIRGAPDGKLYIAVDGPMLSVIHKPNLSGFACDYEKESIRLTEGRSILGLPNAAVFEVNEINYSSGRDTVTCSDFVELLPRNAKGINHQWQDGSLGRKYQADTSGSYWVIYQSQETGCMFYIDTFHLELHKNKHLYRTTVLDAMCTSDTLLLQAKRGDIDAYLWEDQSRGREKMAFREGVYWVNYRIDSVCELYSDTFDVRFPAQNYELSFAADTLYCVGDTIHFSNTSAIPFTRFQWSYGDGQGSTDRSPQYDYSRPGIYRVKLKGWIGDKCADSVIKYLTIDSAFPVRFKTDKEVTCQGEMIRFYPETDANVIALYWNYEQDVYQVARDKFPVQHAFGKAGIHPVTLTAINRVCPETRFTATVEVQALPLVDLGVDSALCWNGQPILLENKAGLPQERYHYLWNTGDTTTGIYAVHHGHYWVRVATDSLGCATTETIDIPKDCYLDIPNAFSPGGDGINDHFFPRQLLSQNVALFKMQVLNRWGQVVFETSNRDGCGWDGRFNGAHQPAGVYVYRIEVLLGDNRRTFYNGNVTLIR